MSIRGREGGGSQLKTAMPMDFVLRTKVENEVSIEASIWLFLFLFVVLYIIFGAITINT